jgi:hypothetical protein
MAPSAGVFGTMPPAVVIAGSNGSDFVLARFVFQLTA